MLGFLCLPYDMSKHILPNQHTCELSLYKWKLLVCLVDVDYIANMGKHLCSYSFILYLTSNEEGCLSGPHPVLQRSPTLHQQPQQLWVAPACCQVQRSVARLLVGGGEAGGVLGYEGLEEAVVETRLLQRPVEGVGCHRASMVKGMRNGSRTDDTRY